MNPPPVTALAETAALYAVLNDDEGEARRIILNMTASERISFSALLDRLLTIAWRP